MAKDNLDTSTVDAIGLLWKVNFSFVDTSDFIRTKTLIIKAANAVDAQAVATNKIQSFKYSRIVSVKPY